MRTLEQKIADAGPAPQRIDPHLLTPARKQLIDEGVVGQLQRGGISWFYLTGTSQAKLAGRLEELVPIHEAVSARGFTMRLGQTLEIAIYRTLLSQTRFPFLGAFRDLAEHGDDRLYRKEEPPAWISGRPIPAGGRFDFVLTTSDGLAAIEAKNLREWIYPDRKEVRDLLRKCVHVDAVPVLIARRIHYSTFSLLRHCGVLLHQTYNQLFPRQTPIWPGRQPTRSFSAITTYGSATSRTRASASSC